MLKYLLDTLEGLDEALHKFYKEVDGKFVLQITGGATPDQVTRLDESLKKERKDHKETKDKLAKWGSLDSEEVLPQLDEIEELKLKAESSEGKIDQEAMDKLIDARVARAVTPITRERDQLKSQVETLTGDNTTLTGKITAGTISTAIAKAGADANILPGAMEDLQMLAERVFEVADDGVVVVKADSGYAQGSVPKDFLVEIQDSRSHWWEASKGGGSHGDKKKLGGIDNPWTPDSWNVTKQGAVVREHGIEKANELAASANSKVGATSATIPAP